MVIATAETMSDDTAMMKINEKILFFSSIILSPEECKIEKRHNRNRICLDRKKKSGFSKKAMAGTSKSLKRFMLFCKGIEVKITCQIQISFMA